MSLNLGDFEPGNLTASERQQHRLMWAERAIRVAQREAWNFWARVFYAIIGGAGTLAGLWTFWVHGGK